MMDRMVNTTLLGAVVALLTLSSAADFVRENELDVEAVVQQMSIPQQVVDLRTTFPVASLKDTALKGLMYSANSWERDAVADATRTATITAQAGSLADGVFTPDGSAELPVLPTATGEGTVDWAVT